jgi:hypothetical protein
LKLVILRSVRDAAAGRLTYQECTFDPEFGPTGGLIYAEITVPLDNVQGRKVIRINTYDHKGFDRVGNEVTVRTTKAAVCVPTQRDAELKFASPGGYTLVVCHQDEWVEHVRAARDGYVIDDSAMPTQGGWITVMHLGTPEEPEAEVAAPTKAREKVGAKR